MYSSQSAIVLQPRPPDIPSKHTAFQYYFFLSISKKYLQVKIVEETCSHVLLDI